MLFHEAKRAFETDWIHYLTVIELGAGVLGFIPDIFEQTGGRKRPIASELESNICNRRPLLGKGAGASNFDVFSPQRKPSA